jgi:hypothetical protein
MKKIFIGAVGIILIALLVGGVWFAIKSTPCLWRYSGIESRYRPFIGCQIHVGNGVWVPEDKYRATD